MKNSYLSWKYKREVLITNPSATEGFQASFVLRWKPGMKKDFRDVRFSTLRGKTVYYYLESVTNYSSCRVWLKLPASTSKLWMYYGNGGVQTASSGSAVFDFWDDFLTLNTSVWTKVHGVSTVSGGILTLESTTLNSILQSVQTFAVNNIVEARAYHAQTNRSIIGFRNTTTELAAAWHGPVTGDTNYYDYRFTHNGTSGTWTSDAVSRGGSTYYVYGVAHLTAGPKFYVNYSLRGTASLTLPGSTALPIHFYSEYNKGPVKVDWVRIRKYAATEPTISLGKRFTNQPNKLSWENPITTSTSLGMTSDVGMKYYIVADSELGLKPLSMFRHPSYFRIDATGPYKKWKFKGDISTPYSTSQSVVNVLINQYPGMSLDGRDLRFSTIEGDELTYYIESLTEGVFSVWVQIPESTRHINFYYGNGLATSESDVSIYSGPISTETVTKVYPVAVFGYFYKWKYKGYIYINNPDANSVQVNITIPIYPGMAKDGRDIRFSDSQENPIPYYLESVSSTSLLCIVKIPARASLIYFFYGNGIATDASSPDEVFDFWDDFSTLDAGDWTLAAGSAAIINGTLRLSNATANSLLRSSATYETNTLLEFRMNHPYQNQTIAGYWSASNQRACWLGAYTTSSNDHMHTMDGSTQTTVSDGITRAGAQFYTYGVEYLSAGPKFYVDYVYRGQITTHLPTGDLPISFYSEDNEGDLIVDWVRVRKSTTATATVGQHRPRKQAVDIIDEEQDVERAIVQRKYPQKYGAIPYFEYVSTKKSLGMQVSEPTYKERRELSDYSLVSCDISKSISDSYTQLSAEFADLVVPPEKSTVKYIARDDSGNEYILFHGKVISNSLNIGSSGDTLSMQASDYSRNLAVQKIPWNYQIINSNTISFAMWIRTLLDSNKTGVVVNTILDTDSEDTEFAFDPKTSRLEAIQEIASYTNSIINIKLISRLENEVLVTRPEFFCVPPEYIDQTNNGFDLPDPITFIYPDSTIIDNPKIQSEQDEKYNKVIVYGTLSDTQEITVAAAYSNQVYTGEEKAKEYIIEDNSIVEKGSTAEIEAIKWLIYFLTPRATVNVKFVNRFDLELYQRIKFGSGFSKELQTLTNYPQISKVWAFDPRDELNSTHDIDVSDVPIPRWLRISSIKYHSETALETCEIEAITDFIYSVIDPVINYPYSNYLSTGYRKPVIDDLIGTTQTIVDDTVEKQLQPEICTVLSINTENNTAVVQTASGKLVTVQLP